MTYAKLALTALFLLLTTALIVALVLFFQERGKSERWQTNFDNITQILSEQNITKNEFKNDYPGLLDSINKYFKLNLKPKELNYFNKYFTSYYSTDTVIEKITPVNGSYAFHFTDSCISYSVIFNSSDSTFMHVYAGYESETREVSYWTKPKIFPKSEKINWKKFWKVREYHKEIDSPCADSIKVESVNVVKR